MYSTQRFKSWAKPLTAILMVCLVFTMAPLMPGMNADVNADASAKVELKMLTEDGTTQNAITIDTWTFDSAKNTYMSNGKELSIAKSFKNPYVYSSSKNRLAVVTKGILMDDIYDYASKLTGYTFNKKSKLIVWDTVSDFGTPADPSLFDDYKGYYIPGMYDAVTSTAEKTEVPMVLSINEYNDKNIFTLADINATIEEYIGKADSKNTLKLFHGQYINPVTNSLYENDDPILGIAPKGDNNNNLNNDSARNINVIYIQPTEKSIAKAKSSLSKAKYTATGKQIKPTVSIKTFDKTLKNGTDYTVSYGTNKLGKGTIKLTGKGNYSGTVTKTFTINPRSTSIKSIKAGKKKATVKWRKAKDSVTGYQIAYKKSSAKKYKVVTVKGKSKSAKTIKKLTKNKKYSIKVRTYYKKDGKTYYSSYSKVKKSKKIKR